MASHPFMIIGVFVKPNFILLQVKPKYLVFLLAHKSPCDVINHPLHTISLTLVRNEYPTMLSLNTVLLVSVFLMVVNGHDTKGRKELAQAVGVPVASVWAVD